MAQTGYTPISLYYTTTASAVPTAGNLVNGELAININTADGKLFYKDSAGVVQTLATKGTAAIGGATTQVQYNLAGALAGSANMIFDASGLALTSQNASGTTGTLRLVDYSSNNSTNTIQWTNNSLSAQYGYISGISAGGLLFGNASGEVMRYTSAGKVGIGTTSPNAELEVIGQIKCVQTQAASTGAIVLRQNSGNTVGGYIQWVSNNNVDEKGWITVNPTGNMQFSSNGLVAQTLDSGGRRTNTYQTFFGAKKDNGVDVSAVTYPTVFNNGYYNIGSAYNGSTGLFTAPVAGRYFFSVEGLSTLSTVLEMSLFVNGGFFLSGRNTGSGYGSTAYCTTIIQLNAGDTVGVQIAAGTMYGSGFNQFTGYLLG
jgi:hypothetical protein